MLKLQGVSKNFQTGADSRLALDQVSFHLNPGELVSVIGSNGAGKSTLLQAISGEISLDSGTIHLGSTKISHLPAHTRSSFLGRVFQDPRQGTAPGFTVEENLALAHLRGTPSLGVSQFFRPALSKSNREHLRATLAELKIGLEDRLTQSVSTLSGGQRQALTLVMATLCRPEVLLLDEHCAALDPRTAEIVMDATLRCVRKSEITTLMVTHNMQHAIQHSDRLFMMDQGRVILTLEKDSLRHKTVEDLSRLFQVQNDRLLLQRRGA